MNKERRKAIVALAVKIADAKDELEALRNEEQDAFDNMPESFQQGERGEAAQSALDTLDEAIGSLDAAIDSMETVTQ